MQHLAKYMQSWLLIDSAMHAYINITIIMLIIDERDEQQMLHVLNLMLLSSQ